MISRIYNKNLNLNNLIIAFVFCVFAMFKKYISGNLSVFILNIKNIKRTMQRSG